MLWFTGVAACAAIASAVFAFVQAKAATDSRRDADEARDEASRARDESARLAGEANAAFVRQAEAQEEANRLRREESRPDDWSLAQIGNNSFRATNSSRQLLLVSEMLVTPNEVKSLVPILTSHDDGRYEYGDSFTFAVVRVGGPSPEKLTIKYRYATDGSDEYRSFHISV
ncbi:hypothetical protein ABCS02_10710 [Microbacterium sp. X-17]|uniref:hypothetical protein n=1 Tax=Microbacterium sp. X-17 TaxID=3144404 RepID=UPI0031F5C77E